MSTDQVLEPEQQGRWELYKVTHAPDTIHNAAEKGEMNKLDEYIQAGVRVGIPESVTLQQREAIMGEAHAEATIMRCMLCRWDGWELSSSDTQRDQRPSHAPCFPILQA